MGQKVNPKILRLGYIFDWSSRWFDEKRYKEVLLEDYKLRNALMEKLKFAGIARVEIERSINNLRITVYVSRPGIVIGRSGTGLEDLNKYVSSLIPLGKKGNSVRKIDIRVEPVKEPNLDSYLVARNIADQIERRMPHRRVLAQSIERVMGAGAKGVRIVLSGRIGGADIGRVEKVQQGKVPLSTIRERIDFVSVPSLTKKGYIGIKVWINRGEK
ncbi:MAG: 30S ribosomal protein S3 [bacterium]|nr:30S ribosomal protein S3 [bacterium]